MILTTFPCDQLKSHHSSQMLVLLMETAFSMTVLLSAPFCYCQSVLHPLTMIPLAQMRTHILPHCQLITPSPPKIPPAGDELYIHISCVYKSNKCTNWEKVLSHSSSLPADIINVPPIFVLQIHYIYCICSPNLRTFFSILAAEKPECLKYADFFCGGLDLGFILV
jgi:hypothetical protein